MTDADMPFDDDTIIRLVLEAESRGVGLAALIAAMVAAGIRHDVLGST